MNIWYLKDGNLLQVHSFSGLRNSRMGRTKLSCLFEYKQIYTIIIHIIMDEKVLSLKQNRGHFLDCPLE